METLAKQLAKARKAGRDLGEGARAGRLCPRTPARPLPIYLGTNVVVKLFTDDRAPAKALRENGWWG